MHIHKTNEAGYEDSLTGMMLSYHDPDPTKPLDDILSWFTPDQRSDVAGKLKSKDRGHNKFLQGIETWWAIRAPRYWWSQFDTYRHAMQSIDPSVSLSESTMHTIMKRQITQSDFENPIWDATLNHLNSERVRGNFTGVKNELPEGFLQLRMVKLNYDVLRNILIQRTHHKLAAEWGLFCSEVLAQVDHPELLPTKEI